MSADREWCRQTERALPSGQCAMVRIASVTDCRNRSATKRNAKFVQKSK
jgi:hypothetical protein